MVYISDRHHLAVSLAQANSSFSSVVVARPERWIRWRSARQMPSPSATSLATILIGQGRLRQSLHVGLWRLSWESQSFLPIARWKLISIAATKLDEIRVMWTRSSILRRWRTEFMSPSWSMAPSSRPRRLAVKHVYRGWAVRGHISEASVASAEKHTATEEIAEVIMFLSSLIEQVGSHK